MAIHTGARSMFGGQINSKLRSAPSHGFGSATRAQAGRVQGIAVSKPGASPGPTAYNMRAAVGGQVDARKCSTPQWGFGTAGRFAAAKGQGGDRHGPGPAAYAPKQAAHGPQVTSKRVSSPAYGFGSSTRDQLRKIYASNGTGATPGPAAYAPKASVGKQVSSRRAEAPAWVFGSDKRFRDDDAKRSAANPGPAAYSLSESVGPQVASCKATAPQMSFGTSNREHRAKMYMSRQQDKSGGVSSASPGPGAYTLASTIGRKQNDSRTVSWPSWGFGTSQRTPKISALNAGTPGPGDYFV